MRTPLTVFLCSTFADLVEERAAVIDALTRLRLQHGSMELFGARPEIPLDTCLQEVRSSDVAVVLLGHRYGSVVPKLGISYSEAEYNEARRLDIPCLVYIRDENIPILPKYFERSAAGLRALDKFKERVRHEQTVAQFKGPQDLAVQVSADLRPILEAYQNRSIRALLEPDPRLLNANPLSDSDVENPIVTLCYPTEVADLAEEIATGLQQQGLCIVMKVLSPDVDGDPFDGLRGALEYSDFLIIFYTRGIELSRRAISLAEVSIARRTRKRSGAIMIPVCIEGSIYNMFHVSPTPVYLEDKDVERGVREVIQAIHANKARR